MPARPALWQDWAPAQDWGVTLPEGYQQGGCQLKPPLSIACPRDKPSKGDSGRAGWDGSLPRLVEDQWPLQVKQTPAQAEPDPPRDGILYGGEHD